MRNHRWWLLFLALLLPACGGCSTIRVTDPYRTATELYLESEATRDAVAQINCDQLRDRLVFVDASYLSTAKEYKPESAPENLFLVAELRARLLTSGVRLVDAPEKAQIILEVRTGGIGIDRLDFLLGIPSASFESSTIVAVPVSTPEIAPLKSTKQRGFASIAYVAFWRDSGEIVAGSGPFIGQRYRNDYWFLGFGPHAVGDIPPAQPIPAGTK